MIERQPPVKQPGFGRVDSIEGQLPPGSRIRVNERDGGAEFYFPAARNLSTVFGLIAFTLAWINRGFST